MIDLCYIYGKKYHEGADLHKSAPYINKETGMNINSAKMYPVAVSSLIDGVLYKDSINSAATKKYFNNIIKDYGLPALKKAIHATELNISYVREHEPENEYIGYVETICKDYKRN